MMFSTGITDVSLEVAVMVKLAGAVSTSFSSIGTTIAWPELPNHSTPKLREQLLLSVPGGLPLGIERENPGFRARPCCRGWSPQGNEYQAQRNRNQDSEGWRNQSWGMGTTSGPKPR